jgi:glycosyltransferase involved in cell wall biosynthesis
VNPYKVQEIRQALMDIKSNKTLRDDLVEKGRENLKRFSASAIAGQYLNLYKRVADGS